MLHLQSFVLIIQRFMTDQQQISNEFEDRKKKVGDLRETGVQPYPDRFERTHTLAEAKALGEDGEVRELEIIGKSPREDVRVCGRLMLVRSHGKLTFARLQDHTGQLQICFMKSNILCKIQIIIFIYL